MKYRIFTILILIFSLFKSQKSFDVIYEADYKLTYKDQNTPNAYAQEAAFALLINNKESYYKNMNKYVSDSLKFEKKLSENTDFNAHLKYFTPFNENIGVTSGKIYVTLTIADKDFKYEEQNDFKWKLHNEFKKIDKFKCQKATITNYGRLWTAYFTNEIPLPFGPYKFNKLPGLIIQISDERGDYNFQLYSFKRRKYVCKSANMNVTAVPVSKEKIFDYRRKEIADQNQFNNITNDSETLKLLRKKSIERSKSYNPIELEIY